MSDITIKREEIPSALKFISVHQHKIGDHYSARVIEEAAAYIRDLERNLAEERETRIRFGKMLDERAKEVGELQRELENVRAVRGSFGRIAEELGEEVATLRRRIAELEGAEPEAPQEKPMWQISVQGRATAVVQSWEAALGFLDELPGAPVEIAITPVTRPKTRKVTFWCNIYPNGRGRMYPAKSDADQFGLDRLTGRAIPVTIDVPVEG